MPNQSYADNIDEARDGQSQIPQLNANFPAMTVESFIAIATTADKCRFLPPPDLPVEANVDGWAAVLRCSDTTIRNMIEQCDIAVRRVAGHTYFTPAALHAACPALTRAQRNGETQATGEGG